MNSTNIGLIALLAFCALYSESELDRIIPPEIHHDAFYDAIYRIASTQPIQTILEIGSSSGLGSTHAFVTGILENPHKPTLYCMELSTVRFAELAKQYADIPYVQCYQVSSVPVSSFPTATDIRAFYTSVHTNLNQYGLERVLGWLEQDIAYVQSANVPTNGIELIKSEQGITDFDVVLIDGSEFTGTAELQLVYGARFILLDDINAFKNYANYHLLLHDDHYELIEENHTLRNGYAIFKRKD
jgi:hypothetical protein